MCYGPQRPDWQRAGLTPSRLEMSRMKFHRHGVLAGFPSLRTAMGSVWIRRWDALAMDVGGLLVIARQFMRRFLQMDLKRDEPKTKTVPPTSAIDTYEAFKPLPRTPGMADDDPLVTSGRYQ